MKMQKKYFGKTGKNWLSKSIGFLLLITFVGSLFLSACQPKPTTNTSGKETTEKSNGSGQESVVESTKDQGNPAEIKVMVWDRGNAAPGTTVEDNKLTQWIQEQVLADCNVKVTYQAVSRRESNNLVQMMMGGGNAPDIILTYDRGIFGSFAMDGGLTELTDAISQYGDKINSELGEILPVGNIADGQYAILAKRNYQTVRHMGMIRKDWLDALNLPVPTTKEELLTALYAFKEKDPGNLGAQLIPWSMGGNNKTEKFYLNFVMSYIDLKNEEDNWVYNDEWTPAFAEGALDGFKQLNKLYNDGIITKDFAIDTDDSLHVQAVSNGYAGFFVDDTMRAIDGFWVQTAMAANPEVNYVPVQAFENSEGEYKNSTNPLYGAYIMIPKTSEAKVEACIKYINWLADPQNAFKVSYTPTVETDTDGLPIKILSLDELHGEGYPGTPNDLCIANMFWDYYKKDENVIKNLNIAYPEFGKEWIADMYTKMRTGRYDAPVIQTILEAESTYAANVRDMAIAYAYNIISCKPDQFDQVQKAKYAELVQAGLEKILQARLDYYKENVAK